MTTRPLGFIAFAAATLCAGSALAQSRPQTPAPRTGVATQPRFEYSRIEGRNTLQACRARQGDVVPYQGVQHCRIPAQEAPAVGALAAGTADQPGSTPAAIREIIGNESPDAQFQGSRRARAGSATPPESAE